MRDQKLEHWLKVDLGHVQPIMLCDIKTQELHVPVQAFNHNFWNALRLSTLPFGMVDLGQTLVRAHLVACVHRLGEPCLFGYMPFSTEEYNGIRQLSRDILEGKATVDV